MSHKKRIAFIKHGSFSHINEHVLDTLAKQFPAYEIDVIDISLVMHHKRNPITYLFYIKEYGLKILFGRVKIFQYLCRTPYEFNKVKKRIKNRLEKKTYTFTFQTQSIFDAGIPGVPHFVYTDHTHLANLYYPGFDKKELCPCSWIALEKSIYRNAALNFTMSSNISSSLVEQYACPPEKVKLVYSGNNSTVTVEESLNDDRYSTMNILFVGVDWERKGGPELLEAFKAVLKIYPQATLTVVGCAPELDVPNCEVVGRVPLAEVSTYYNKASVFCLPTRREPFGIVFLEAFAHKLPIVATTVGALPDIVSNGENGFLVAPNDIKQLTGRLIELLGNAEKCKAFGEHGYQSVAGKYTWEGTGQRIKEHIAEYFLKNGLQL